MKRLWKVIPPCMSDVQGFEAVMNTTEGLGIIDDPSRYKLLGAGKGRGPEGGWQGHGDRSGDHGGFGGRSEERGGHFERGFEHRGGRDQEGSWGGRQGHGGIGGHGGGRGRFGGVLRVMESSIRNPDIITGTESKVLAAFEAGVEQYQPKFVLFCHAPAASMIGSDLEAAAEKCGAGSGLPTAYVNVDGSKDYLYGIGMTLEAMGKLLLTRRETVPDTVNLLGCNTIDWTDEMLSGTEAWLTENGFRVLTRWGMKDTTENLRGAAAAAVNLVVSEAGIRLARYMEAEYGIPYVVGAPFGAKQCEHLLCALRGEAADAADAVDGETGVLVIGEQFAANTIRNALRERNYTGVRVLSFYDMDKSLAKPGDAKLTGEDDLAAQLASDAVQLVFASPDYKPLLKRTARWVDLPTAASQFTVKEVQNINMVGGALDAWLDEALKKGD